MTDLAGQWANYLRANKSVSPKFCEEIAAELDRLRATIAALEKERDAYRAALQRVADLPLTRMRGRKDPNIRARRVAVAALGGDPLSIRHVGGRGASVLGRPE